MLKLLQKKMADLTVEEFIQVMQEVNKKQPKQTTHYVSGFIDDLLINNYEQTPFNKPETKFSEIYNHLSATNKGISKKALVKALHNAGYVDKIKAIKGGTTARFFSARLIKF